MPFSTFSRPRHFGHSFSTLKDNSIIKQPECPPSPPLPQTTLSQPRFSVFGKKAKFNVVSPINDDHTTAVPSPAKIRQLQQSSLPAPTPISPSSPSEANNTTTTKTISQPKRLIKKFELHTQAKSTNVIAANEQEKKEQQRLLEEARERKMQEEQEQLNNPDYYLQLYLNKKSTTALSSSNRKKKTKKSVHFDPFFLEQVCLFTEEQEPIQLKEAHDKHLFKKTALRLLCPYWPRFSSSSTQISNKVIVVNKKWLSIATTNNKNTIKGKILVRNLALDKSVSIRYTFDGWKTVSDIDGWFFGPFPKNPIFDVYEFKMDLYGGGYGRLSDHGEMRGKIEFAIQLTTNDDSTVDYWDNNNGLNYHIRVIADPLNDPYYSISNDSTSSSDGKKGEEEKEVNEEIESEGDNDEIEEKYYIEDDEEEAFEKHSSFTNALKGYQRAKPAHLRKRQPWLGTRYDFSHSLSMEKRRNSLVDGNISDNESEESEGDSNYHHSDGFFVKPLERLILADPSSSYVSPNILPTPSTSSDLLEVTAEKPSYIFINHSAPPSPVLSPTNGGGPLAINSQNADVDSTSYLELLNKYCFYNSDHNDNNNDTSLPKQQNQQNSYFPIKS